MSEEDRRRHLRALPAASLADPRGESLHDAATQSVRHDYDDVASEMPCTHAMVGGWSRVRPAAEGQHHGGKTHSVASVAAHRGRPRQRTTVFANALAESMDRLAFLTITWHMHAHATTREARSRTVGRVQGAGGTGSAPSRPGPTVPATSSTACPTAGRPSDHRSRGQPAQRRQPTTLLGEGEGGGGGHAPWTRTRRPWQRTARTSPAASQPSPRCWREHWWVPAKGDSVGG